MIYEFYFYRKMKRKKENKNKNKNLLSPMTFLEALPLDVLTVLILLAIITALIYVVQGKRKAASARAKKAEQNAYSNPWGRSKTKGKGGYYYAHQGTTGGYADGLKQEDFAMNGPRRLDTKQSESEKTKTSNMPVTVPRGSIERQSFGQTVPMNSLPQYSGKTITSFQFEDAGDLVKIYIRSLPGWDSFQDANIQKSHVSSYWDDRESLVLLVKKSEEETYNLHVKRLFGLVNDVQILVKKKYLLVKLVKADSKKEWTTLNNKVEKKVKVIKGGEGEGEGEEDGGKKTKYMDKADLPFGDDVDDMIDTIYDDIDVGEIDAGI